METDIRNYVKKKMKVMKESVSDKKKRSVKSVGVSSKIRCDDCSGEGL